METFNGDFGAIPFKNVLLIISSDEIYGVGKAKDLNKLKLKYFKKNNERVK